MMKYKVICATKIYAEFEVEAESKEEMCDILDEEVGTLEKSDGYIKIYCDEDNAHLNGVSVGYFDVEDIESEVSDDAE